MYYETPGKTRGQGSLGVIEAYFQEGMPNPEILQAATINAAELLEVKPVLSTLCVGL